MRGRFCSEDAPNAVMEEASLDRELVLARNRRPIDGLREFVSPLLRNESSSSVARGSGELSTGSA